jgi:hypothetical protein
MLDTGEISHVFLTMAEGSKVMLWSWLYTEGHELLTPLRQYLRGHVNLVFRVLLFGGDLLFLAIFWYMQQVLPQQLASVAELWLAGFTATLAALLLFAIGSVRLNGYRFYQDYWILLAIAMMFLLCLVPGVSSIW